MLEFDPRQIRERIIETMKQLTQGTNTDVCTGCQKYVTLGDESIIVGNDRKYFNGRGILPTRCEQSESCLAKDLLPKELC